MLRERVLDECLKLLIAATLALVLPLNLIKHDLVDIAQHHLQRYVLDHPRDSSSIAAVREKVHGLTRRFPVYG